MLLLFVWKCVCPLVAQYLAIVLGKRGVYMLNKMRALRRIDFSALQVLPLDWNYKEEDNRAAQWITHQKRIMADACLLHYYNMNPNTIHRFFGGRWMGEHRRTLEMMKVTSHTLPTEIFLGLGAGLLDGVLNCLYGSVPNKELEANLAREILPAEMKKPALINKAIKKEEVNHLSLVFDRALARFTPHIRIIKLGILEKEGKKDRMYWHSSRTTSDVLHPINKTCDVKQTEPWMKYDTVSKNHCQYLWNTVAHYPGHVIDLYDGDVSGVFPQQLFHPSIAKANVNIHDQVMILSVVLRFGGNFGPASWEPISDGRSFLVVWLYNHCTYQTDLNKESLDMMDLPSTLEDDHYKDCCTIHPSFD